jgi:hypothetical protein
LAVGKGATMAMFCNKPATSAFPVECFIITTGFFHWPPYMYMQHPPTYAVADLSVQYTYQYKYQPLQDIHPSS